MSLTNLIRDAISLTNDVARISDDISELAKEMRGGNQDLVAKIHHLDKRLMKLENMVEFAEKFVPRIER